MFEMIWILFSKVPNVQVSDTTGDDSSNAVR